MASSVKQTVCCACKKRPASITCHGCEKNLCGLCYDEHRKDLEKRMLTLPEKIQIFSESFNQADHESHPWIAEIEDWKKEATKKIEQAANDAIETFKKALDGVRNDLKEKSKNLKEEVELCTEGKNYTDAELNHFENELKEFEQEKEKPSTIELINCGFNQPESIALIQVNYKPAKNYEFEHKLDENSQWDHNGRTILEQKSSIQGNETIGLDSPFSIDIDHLDEIMYIADCTKDRILAMKLETGCCEVFVGGNGTGNELDQLAQPTALVVDHKTRSLIIADWKNKRIIRRPLQKNAQNEIIASGISCNGLAIDKRGNTYISDNAEHRVLQYPVYGDIKTVAGGNGRGNGLNQLNGPSSLFVDKEGSLYISDSNNNRVVRWETNAQEGIIVAGDKTSQLTFPRGLFVDSTGSIYVVNQSKNCIMRWCKNSDEGTLIVGQEKGGASQNELKFPYDLAFDQDGRMYVSDLGNHRIQVFDVQKEVRAS